MKTLTESLIEVHDILDATNVAHALCGGLAANLYREDVRATNDVDFAVVVGAARVVDVVRVLDAAGWRAEPDLRHGEQLRLERAGYLRVDCLVATTDYERKAIEHATVAQVEDREVHVLTAEDLVIFKLVAGRARDYEAVAAIINSVGRTLDEEYITGWLDQLGHTESWRRALEEARRESGG